ncbi:hypothetical protein [Fluviispira vulneris]|uniref:hypothetical protein n=1 Tax=Fluviispira vulneris TaxID=2763012 RepID=UPI001644F832|nr:hypothetical protein [Fluviispira vulneris]
MYKKYFFFNFTLFALVALIYSCGLRKLPQPIGSNFSYPGSIVSDSPSSFLLLNTSANDDYSDGSIQRYTVDSNGNQTLASVISVPSHATEITVTYDGKLVPLSFDDSYSKTIVQFYDYSSPNNPKLLENLTLTFPSTGGKQAIKRLGTFQRTSETNFYYVYGTIYTSANLDGTKNNIPPRTFLAKVATNFSSSQNLMLMSYGLGDPNSFVKQSTAFKSANSTIDIQYTFGFEAATYDVQNDLFIAFPTGTIGKFAGGVVNNYPSLPKPLEYFSNTDYTPCTSYECADFRAVSLAAVYMPNLVSGKSVDESTFFVPLAWNQNGIPYAARSNGVDIVYSAKLDKDDTKSFSFQSQFWSSYWSNTPNPGNALANPSTCYGSTATSNANQYGTITQNSLFVVKKGTNGTNQISDNSADGSTGYGGEIFLINGFDLLAANITSINTARNADTSVKIDDFASLAKYQVVDRYNSTTNLNSNWLNGSATGSPKNGGPLTYYMYSRTSSNTIFKNLSTAVPNLKIFNFGGGNCRPYWYRVTTSAKTYGLDTTWIGNNFSGPGAGATTYPGATLTDPTLTYYYSFPTTNGANLCTDVSVSGSTPFVFCYNFLYNTVTRFKVTQTSGAFTIY